MPTRYFPKRTRTVQRWSHKLGKSKHECGVITPTAPQNTVEFRKPRWEAWVAENLYQARLKKIMRSRRVEWEKTRDEKNRPEREALMAKIKSLQARYALKKEERLLRNAQ